MSIHLNRHLIVFLALLAPAAILHLNSKSSEAFAQTRENRSLADLTISSAAYIAKTDTIVVEVANKGQRAATAFQLNVTVRKDDQVIKNVQYIEDHLEVLLTAREKAGSDTLWSGVIGPQDVFSGSWKGNISVIDQTSARISVQAVVAGVIWSDGTVDALNAAATNSMNSFLSSRAARARTGKKIIAILESHAGDSDAQHRLSSIQSDVTTLQTDYQTQKAHPIRKNMLDASATADDPGELHMTAVNLEILGSTADPAKALDSYQAWAVSRYHRRMTLLNNVSPSQTQ